MKSAYGLDDMLLSRQARREIMRRAHRRIYHDYANQSRIVHACAIRRQAAMAIMAERHSASQLD